MSINDGRGLNVFTKEQLLEELKRREEAERLASVPKRLNDIDWTSVIAQAEDIVSMASNQETPRDCEEYIFEEVMTAIFGKDFFSWYNKVLE
jgi:hypothetical protein